MRSRHMHEVVEGVEIVRWNPRIRIGSMKRRIGPRINNFGDLLGPEIVRRIVARDAIHGSPASDVRVLAVGSILHLAHTDDIVWGGGVNGKIPDAQYRFERIDVRAVRGPRTREYLEQRGCEVPAVYGDPAMLLPQLMPQLVEWSHQKVRRDLIVPNMHDYPTWRSGHRSAQMLNPRAPLMKCLKTIAQSERVIGSSLHGLIVAESLGIPATPVSSGVESPFKYLDHFEGTGRRDVPIHSSLAEGLATGIRPVEFALDTDALLAAFPSDRWTAARP